MPVDTLGQRLMLQYRRAAQVLLHLLLWAVSLMGAFLLRFEFSLPDEYFPRIYRWTAVLLARFEFSPPDEYFPRIYGWIAVLVALRVIGFATFGMFSGMWRYTGARDL